MTSRLATVAKTLSAGQFGFVAGQSAPDGGTVWSFAFTNPQPPGVTGVIGGAMAELAHCPYDMERRRVLPNGTGHDQSPSTIRFWMGVYDIDTNTARDIGATSPVGPLDGLSGSANHNYSSNTFDNQRNFWRHPQNGGTMVRCHMDKATSAIDSGDWAVNPITPLYVGSAVDRSFMVFWPDLNALVYCLQPGSDGVHDNGLYLWVLNSLTGAWVKVFDFLTDVSPSYVSEGMGVFYSPIDHCLIFGGGQDVKLWKMAPDLIVHRLDDYSGVSPSYDSSTPNSMSWVDPISGRFYVLGHTTSNVSAGFAVLGCKSCDINASPGSQWRDEPTIATNANAWALAAGLGEIGGSQNILNNVCCTELWDQGVIIFMGEYNISILKCTANNRAGWETGDGALTAADKRTLPGYIWDEPFADQSGIHLSWNGADTALSTAVAGAGYSTNYGFSYLPGGANALAVSSQPNTLTFVPTVVTYNGKPRLQLPIHSGGGENGARYINSLNGQWNNNGSRFFIGPESPHGPVIWIQFNWQADPAYWATLFRHVGANVQSMGTNATVTAGSNVMFVPGIVNVSEGFNSTTGLPVINGKFDTWAIGKQFAVTNGPDIRDAKFLIIHDVIDNTHVHVVELDGTTPHNFFTSTSSLQIDISGAGLFQPGNFDKPVDAFKLSIYEGTQPNQVHLPAGGAVVDNQRKTNYSGFTNSPNMYTQEGGFVGLLNDGTVPFVQNGDNIVTMRFEMLTALDPGFGGTFRQARMQMWLNGVGGPTYPNITDLTLLLDSGPNDGAGNPYGLSQITLTMQHTYGDPNQIINGGAGANVYFSDLITSTMSIPLGPNAADTTPPPPPLLVIHKYLIPFLLRK